MTRPLELTPEADEKLQRKADQRGQETCVFSLRSRMTPGRSRMIPPRSRKFSARNHMTSAKKHMTPAGNHSTPAG